MSTHVQCYTVLLHNHLFNSVNNTGELSLGAVFLFFIFDARVAVELFMILIFFSQFDTKLLPISTDVVNNKTNK